MKKVLVLGGTRFFGVHLVEALLNEGIEVTVATRGNTAHVFSKKVNQMVIDRSSLLADKEKLQSEKWDVVFDQICYASRDALDAVEVFNGHTKKYVLTSSKSVYEGKELSKEEDFIPEKHSIVMGTKENFTYAEGKRQAEAVFFQHAEFPVAAVRPPIVIGEHDYTNRLKYYVGKIMSGDEFHLVNSDAYIDFISEEEIGQFLAWIGLSTFTGAVNATTNGKIKLKDLVHLIEAETGKEASISLNPIEGEDSPYNLSKTWLMSNERAKSLGYSFEDLHDYLPKLLKKL
ncbi:MULTISPECIES: NAD-dependent epimerase/dehydratase family protein [unclassified Psychrobacillus]|uniref:NAD-dependent epimerase/dehydratase family protein n=1 Tax=unclassified Psychrobacillus TaxID=2636677 RepID=UPI00146B1E30|nr:MULTISPECIES: NAD-dependent epimerase/dehydratase family protein [unclassified Psychrobacillus]MCM3356638.1 NAD-dependent epimerase/dehydratase family protein [Psychrobacillus sp. MER TA 171]NME07821.1 NAD-dependent epimerase/dehydratase family protein [Psychrobacillus sp. BL-248-WT-3]